MNFRSLLPALLALLFLGSAAKPPCTIRFYSAGNERDGSPFTASVVVGNPPRKVFVSKIPVIAEPDILSVYPFPAADGTYGCALKLDRSGTIRLNTVSVEQRGTPLVCVVNGRVVTAILIDRPISDGILFITSGLSVQEIAVFTKRFRVMGSSKSPKAATASKSSKHTEAAELPDRAARSYSRGD